MTAVTTSIFIVLRKVNKSVIWIGNKGNVKKNHLADKLLELVIEFNKVTGYRVQVKNRLYFHILTKQLETKIV